MNALAAVAASLMVGAGLDEAAAGLASLAPVPGRLCPLAGINGARLIDDDEPFVIDGYHRAERFEVTTEIDTGEPGEHELVIVNTEIPKRLNDELRDLLEKLAESLYDDGKPFKFYCVQRGGLAADIRPEGCDRGFNSSLAARASSNACGSRTSILFRSAPMPSAIRPGGSMPAGAR